MLVGNSGLVPAVNVFLRLSLRLSLVNTRLVSREFLGRDVAAEEHQESTKVRGDFREQPNSGMERRREVRRSEADLETDTQTMRVHAPDLIQRR